MIRMITVLQPTMLQNSIVKRMELSITQKALQQEIRT